LTTPALLETPVNVNYAVNQLGSDDVIPNRKLDEIGIVFQHEALPLSGTCETLLC
jgi:hypothetical protein